MKEDKKVKKALIEIKRKLAKKYSLNKLPSNIEILNYLTEKPKDIITKPTRTISGVAPIAVMTKPFECPHVKSGVGPCIMCPGGPKSFFGDIPQSYTGKEPATMRAVRNKFDPYLQVFNRLEQYVLLNQNFDKVEIIIMGGTFPSYPEKYQKEFVYYIFKALNDFSKMFFVKDKFDFVKFKKFFELPGNVHDIKRAKKVQVKVLKLKGKSSLEKEQLKNETAKVRCVALCIETRPDYCKEENINLMLKLGCTRVELGLQSIYNDVLDKINRGHKIEDTIRATQLLKDSFLKVTYHIMPGLPESDKKRDIKMFKELFSNEDFKPDMLKIYPCMVLKGTKLYNLWKAGKFKAITTEQAAEEICELKRIVPKWVRISRIQRDISIYATESGVGITNLRQYVNDMCIKKRINCKCIRCKEPRDKEIDWNNVKLLRQDYEASNGKEIFLSFEDVKNDILLGFCRLRIPYKPFRKEITKDSAGIRELHVYGEAVEIGKSGEIQHKGLGKQLMLEAERIAKKEFNIKKLFVISGIGVRKYYKNKLGYKKEGPYMVKEL
ncbi:MAG: tRNA uridine(34) 5-carboxymethylaminomethyl modification radical SAM/GNAT enzyme Elp3 [Candidatus Nanoarchaeia archaeon]|nr:tRNA uridine(34) 5-carboxymethylaminomethyl modification radical SAM/GNAT enzyme Elp3 [Candidatus Nanoarchaeia archaeon]MDD5588168.1 tRNA uridine(34) 5-carboxymethylaminomethyl modification radical SAM/GNAT enzyme Elp3 [Candidatus Nanoarchaeia archaeon]